MSDQDNIIPILIVNFNGRGFIEACLSSLAEASTRERIVVYVVDNASSDDSVRYLTEEWPDVRLIRSHANLGFAGGNNLGWHVIRRDFPECRYVFLLNQDTLVDRDFLRPLRIAMESDDRLAAAQPLLLLHPDKDRINSLGNVIHVLGFGYSSYNGAPLGSTALTRHRINYASGASVMLRVEAIDQVGLFDAFMFMYLEDLDLGWRLSLAGWESQLVPDSIVYHKYEFKRGMRQYYYFERNRIWILLKNYKAATLILLLPLVILMELGQLIRAAFTGTLQQKLRGYGYFLSLRNMRMLLKDRRRTQRMRIRSDRELLGTFSGRIDFQPLKEPLVTYVMNPVCSAYLRFLHTIALW